MLQSQPNIQMQQILNLIYPVGSLYFSTTMSTKEQVQAALGGTWEKLPEGYAIWTASDGAGNTIAPGLPNIAGKFNAASYNDVINDGAFSLRRNANNVMLGTSGNSRIKEVYFSAASGECGTQKPDSTFSTMSYANNVYGKSETVQPPAYKVYAYKRLTLGGLRFIIASIMLALKRRKVIC